MVKKTFTISESDQLGPPAYSKIASVDKDNLFEYRWPELEYGEFDMHEEEMVRASAPSLISFSNRNEEAVSSYTLDIRRQFFDALKSIVAHVSDKHSIPLSNGLDIGSGGGTMVNHLLPKKAAREFLQTDINPHALELIETLNPRSRTMTASYLRLNDHFQPESFTTVTGLSCLDSTMHMKRALEGVATVLEDDGILLHVQDVVPSIDIALQELADMGTKQPFIGERLHALGYPYRFLTRDRATKKITTYFGTELFRQRIGRLIGEIPELTLIENRWFTATRPLRRNYSMYVHGQIEIGIAKNVDTEPMQEVSTLVTVAKRRPRS